MREADVQAVLMVRAFEELDSEGALLPAEHRSRATSEARGAVGEEAALTPQGQQALLVHRARALLPELQARVPGAGRARAAAKLGGVITPLVVVGSLALGFGTNALGPDRTVNVLSAPLLGVLAWNLAIYLALGVAVLKGARPPRELVVGGEAPASGGVAEGLTHGLLFLGGLAQRLVDRALGRHAAHRAQQHALAVRAFGRYARYAGVASEVLLAIRLRRLLHLGSAMLASAAITGMYVRGLVLAYAASWQSTFLDASQVQAVLGVVLGPAAWILGRGVPDVSLLQHPTTGDAAPWIHLYAMSAVLIVLLPRGLLYLVDSLTLRRLARSLRLDLEAPAFRRQLMAVRGAGTTVTVLPYGARPEARARDGLAELLHDVLGARTEVRFAEALGYGDEAADVPDIAPGDRPAVVLPLFALGQSPEAEVHGRFVAELAARLGPGGRLVALVDEGDFATRVGDGARRLDERRRAWNRVLADEATPTLHVRLGRPLPTEVFERLLSALRTGGESQG